MKQKTFSLTNEGIIYEAIFSDLADQTNGSVILKANGTMIMATAVMSKKADNNPGYFNLTVEYQEKNYASGEILGGQYNKREGRPSENAILSGRIIDRTIRPLFDQSIQNAIQVSVTVLALGNFDPTILGVLGASLSLSTSDIPWNGPISAINISKTADSGLRLNNYKLRNQKDTILQENQLDILLCGDSKKINMIESGAKEIPDDLIKEIIKDSVKKLSVFQNWQQEIIKEIGKEKLIPEKLEILPEMLQLSKETLDTLKNNIFGENSKEKIKEIENIWNEKVKEKFGEENEIKKMSSEVLYRFFDEVFHYFALEKKQRPDNRRLDEIRKIYAQAGNFSDRLHGTGIFYRGETHILSVLTLGGPDDRQTTEGIEKKENRQFMHHYNFPPFSTGEVGRFEGANRRSIGHGALGEKALKSILPDLNVFPYTIRLVSEAFASNGSTSQASICAGSLALMDGGVPIKSHIAGISIGCMIDYSNENNFVLLTDIQGPEDHHGDMDFKIAGTTDGICAIQLDVKVMGISPEILIQAIDQAKKARLEILTEMNKAIENPRADMSPLAPRIDITIIPVDKIGLIIGSGGKTINDIMKRTGAQINIEEDGKVYLTGQGESTKKAKEIIESMTKIWSVGETGTGVVSKILDGIGVLVKLGEMNEGLVHISEIANFRVENIESLIKIGQEVPFTIIKLEPEKNRIGLSIKKNNPDFFNKDKAI